MNRLKYFLDPVTVEEALTLEGDTIEDCLQPERVPYEIRETMELLAYRSAVWYNPQGKAVMFYDVTTKGVRAIGIKDEDRKRDNNVEQVSIPYQESRLLG